LGPPAVATHRGDHPRAKPQLIQGIDGRPGDPVDAGDPPAADRDGDRPSGPHPATDPAPEDRTRDGARDVVDLGLAGTLADAGDWRKPHRMRNPRWEILGGSAMRTIRAGPPRTVAWRTLRGRR